MVELVSVCTFTVLAKYAWPVVVAPPFIVRPLACVPPPIVDDASEYKPSVKPMRLEVALLVVPNVSVGVNGKALPPLAHAADVTRPPVVACRQVPDVRPDTTRLVVLAVPNVASLVVDALAKVARPM